MLDTLLGLIREEAHPETINPVVMRALNLSIPFTKKTAFNTFIQSGDIRYLRDFETKSELVTLYEFYDIGDTYSEVLVDNYDTGFFSHIRAKLDIAGGTPQPMEAYTDRGFVNSVATLRHILTNSISILNRDRERMQAFVGEDDGQEGS